MEQMHQNQSHGRFPFEEIKFIVVVEPFSMKILYYPPLTVSSDLITKNKFSHLVKMILYVIILQSWLVQLTERILYRVKRLKLTPLFGHLWTLIPIRIIIMITKFTMT